MSNSDLTRVSEDSARALGVHIAVMVGVMLDRRLKAVGIEDKRVKIVLKAAAVDPLVFEYAGEPMVFPVGEVVEVSSGVLTVLESMGRPSYKGMGLGVTKLISGIEFEVL